MSQHRSLIKRRVTKKTTTKHLKKYAYPNILGSNGLNIRPKLLVETIEHITNGQKGHFTICCSNTFGTEREKKKKKKS